MLNNFHIQMDRGRDREASGGREEEISFARAAHLMSEQCVISTFPEGIAWVLLSHHQDQGMQMWCGPEPQEKKQTFVCVASVSTTSRGKLSAERDAFEFNNTSTGAHGARSHLSAHLFLQFQQHDFSSNENAAEPVFTLQDTTNAECRSTHSHPKAFPPPLCYCIGHEWYFSDNMSHDDVFVICVRILHGCLTCPLHKCQVSLPSSHLVVLPFGEETIQC